MSHKKLVKNQNYEDYWQLTLGNTDFYGTQFVRILKLMVDHIDKYGLADKSEDELVKGNGQHKKFNQEVTHAKELEDKVYNLYPKADRGSTRKEMNQYIKLGFIKPYYHGYAPAAKEYIKSTQTTENRQRLFSDTVYQYATFNSSGTKSSPYNQMKFIVQTILNRDSKKLTYQELKGLMSDTHVLEQKYAQEKVIQADSRWVDQINFQRRKYNQIGYIFNVLSKMSLFKVVGRRREDKVVVLADHAPEYFPEPGDTTRDTYRFSLMKKAVYDESIRHYGKKICWLTKKESMGLVVSHLYASAEALRKYDNDAAYDPQNALLLAPGNPDQYLDKYKMTFDMDGNPIFTDDDDSMFVQEVEENHYKIDKEIMTPDRQHYMKIHNKYFEKKNNQKTN